MRAATHARMSLSIQPKARTERGTRVGNCPARSRRCRWARESPVIRRTSLSRRKRSRESIKLIGLFICQHPYVVFCRDNSTTLNDGPQLALMPILVELGTHFVVFIFCVTLQTRRAIMPKRAAIGHFNTLSGELADSDGTTQSIKNEFARRLEARRIELGWNQSELARRASEHLPKPAKGQKQGHSIGRDQISHYSRGISLPRPEVLRSLAKALGCEPRDLVPAAYLQR